MELTGRIIAIMEPRSGVSARTGNSWMTQEYVLEVPGQYPKRCLFNIFGEDRIKQYNIQLNEDITVQFDIDAREYNGRWYNDIRAYNVLRGQVPVAVLPQWLLPSRRHLMLLLLPSRLLKNRRVRVVPTICPSNK